MTAINLANATWDLTGLYKNPSDPLLQEHQNQAKQEAEILAARFRGRIETLSPNELLELLHGLERVWIQCYRPAWFARLLFSAQTDDVVAKTLLNNSNQKAVEISNLITFADLELAQLSDAAVARFLDAPGLSEYHHAIEAKRRFRPHVLSESEEQLFNTMSLTGSRAWSQLYTEISSRIRVSLTVDGQEKFLSLDEVRALRSRPERELRGRAVNAMYSALSEHEHVLTYIFNTLYQDWKNNNSVRHYTNPIAATVLQDELQLPMIEALFATTLKNADILQQYFSWKAKRLGITDFSTIDLLAPLAENPKTYGFDEAKTLVLRAFARFHPDFEKLARAFFDEGRIDVRPRPGKRGGAFCSSFSPHDHAYVLLNYQDRLDDVMTLAHELGHGLHAELSRVQNPTNYGHSTPLAETASIFCEMLVVDALLENADAETQRDMAAHVLEDAAATIYRQIHITTWEQKAHAECAMGIVTSARFSELWLAEFKKYYGDVVAPTPGDAWGWIGIPHVIGYRFYCYSYAFGNLLVFALYQRYKTEGPEFAARYHKFLSAGEKADPVALVSELGVDLNDQDFWQSGFDYLRSLLKLL